MIGSQPGGGEAAPGNDLSVARCAILSMATLEETDVKQETSTKEGLDIPWQVVVHNDPVNLMTYVTMVFQRVFGYPRAKAERHMLEVHQQGRSIVWCGVRERAEL